MAGKEIRCAWCGQTFQPTRHDRPRQHRNGAQVCVGSGQVRATHEQLVKANEEARKKGGK